MNESNPATEVSEPALPVVLFVDDEVNILSALKRLFRTQGYKILSASSGAEALEIMEGEPADLVISDMRMPVMDGTQLLEQVRGKWPDTMRILLTGYADIGSTISAINRGEIYRYIAKPWDDNELVLQVKQALDHRLLQKEKQRLEQLTFRQNEELKELNATLERKVLERTAQLRQAMTSLEEANAELNRSFFTSIKIFSNLMELRAGRLAGHSRRVAEMARTLAQHMGMSEADTQDVVLAGLLHDIGKIGLPDRLLDKPFVTLNSDERALVMKHPLSGKHALMSLDRLKNVAELVGLHHERFDGLGFPGSASGTSIPLGARILALANDFDAIQIGTMKEKRYTAQDAFDFVAGHSGRRYDPEVVKVFKKAFGAFENIDAFVEIKSADLKAGMVLAHDLVAPDGMLLLSHDYALDLPAIENIRHFEQQEGCRLRIRIRPRVFKENNV